MRVPLVSLSRGYNKMSLMAQWTLRGLAPIKADCALTGKNRSGECLWLNNDRWCTNVTVHRRYRSADLELFHLECRPHYLPREINLINPILVYCVPQANTKNCQNIIDDIIFNCNSKHPDSATIVVGDFNSVRLKHLYQYVDFNTRGNKVLNLCYSNMEVHTRRINCQASDHLIISRSN